MTIQVRSLPELVDLALRTPIIGVVNFDILRTVLQILIKEMGLQNFRAKVNIRDMKPQELQMPPSPRRPSAVEHSIALEYEAEQMLDEELDVPESEEVSWTQSRAGSQEESEQAATPPPPSVKAASQPASEKEVAGVASADEALPVEDEVEREQSKSTVQEEQKSVESEAETQSRIKGKHITTAGRCFDETRSTVSSDVSLKAVETFQEEMTEFWKSTNISSRISALEGGIDKIVDIIDEQARDLEHFRRDSERRRTKDNNFMKKLKEDFDQITTSTEGLSKKVGACVPDSYFQDQMERYINVLEEMNNQLLDVEGRLDALSEKLKGEYKMCNVLDDIIDIKTLLKVPTKKSKPTRYSTGGGGYGGAVGYPDPRAARGGVGMGMPAPGMSMPAPGMGMPAPGMGRQRPVVGMPAPVPKEMMPGISGTAQKPVISAQRVSSPKEALLTELRKSMPGAETAKVTEMKKATAYVTDDMRETAAVTDDMKMAAAPEHARREATDDMKRSSTSPGDMRMVPSATDDMKRISATPDETRKVSAPGDTRRISAAHEDPRKLSAAPEDARRISATTADRKRISESPGDAKRISATPEDTKRVSVASDRRISSPPDDVKRVSAAPDVARRSTVGADIQREAEAVAMQETGYVQMEAPSPRVQRAKSVGAGASPGRSSALSELRKSRAEMQRETSSPESYSAVAVEHSAVQRQRIVTSEVSPEGHRAVHMEEEMYHQTGTEREYTTDDVYRGYGEYEGFETAEPVAPATMEREPMMSYQMQQEPIMSPRMQQEYEVSDMSRGIEGMDIDMQQVVGAAYEFEVLQNVIEGLRLKIDVMEDQSREMKRMKEEEALANEEKMAEKERLIDRLTAGMVQSSDKMGDVQHTVKMLSEKVYEVIEMVKEIGKIQDEMAEEGRKNLLSVEEQMREVFKELRKFTMLEEIQLLVEDVKHSKAERSEMLDALDRKADKSQLDCKLDKTMFETLCEEFNHGFDDLMVKISALEQQLERAVQDINVVLEQKLERKEMDQYRDHMKERLKAIVTKLKQMKEIIEEDPDAAGIKIRCLSCDRPLRKPERNYVVSDGSLNPTLPKRMPDHPSENAFLPPLAGDGSFRAAGGWHTLTTPPLRIRTTAGAGLSGEKIWEEVPLQGTDGRVYQGYLEKVNRTASA